MTLYVLKIYVIMHVYIYFYGLRDIFYYFLIKKSSNYRNLGNITVKLYKILQLLLIYFIVIEFRRFYYAVVYAFGIPFLYGCTAFTKS